MSVKSFFAAVGYILTTVIATLFTFLITDKIRKKNNSERNLFSEKKIDQECEKIKKEVEDEIKKTDSNDLVKSSSNYSDIQSGIEKLQSDSTERIRNRLKEKL